MEYTICLLAVSIIVSFPAEIRYWIPEMAKAMIAIRLNIPKIQYKIAWMMPLTLYTGRPKTLNALRFHPAPATLEEAAFNPPPPIGKIPEDVLVPEPGIPEVLPVLPVLPVFVPDVDPVLPALVLGLAGFFLV